MKKPTGPQASSASASASDDLPEDVKILVFTAIALLGRSISGTDPRPEAMAAWAVAVGRQTAEALRK